MLPKPCPPTRFNPRTRVGCDDDVINIMVADHIVSIHAPAWGATLVTLKICLLSVSFNPRTRVGCDSRPLWPARWRCCFNPRTRVGCDPTAPAPTCAPWWFQSTHPRGVRHVPADCRTVRRRFQSTHPRGVRLAALLVYVLRPRLVSIHAPAWGATAALRAADDVLPLFQSTHPRGVRRRGHSAGPPPGCFNPRTRVGCDDVREVRLERVRGFNPRTRVGCDQLVFLHLSTPEPVSIHAPAWGATPRLRLHVGIFVKFQSTHPRGVRRPPTHRRVSGRQVSIHAPAWGATLLTNDGHAGFHVVSIHAPAWGAT